MARITQINDLLFPVELQRVYYESEINGTKTKIEIPRSKVVVNRKSGDPLGVVSDNYKLISNEEALSLGKKCCAVLFGVEEASNVEVFQVEAPSTASYCYIDLVHRNYVMNLWDEKNQSEIYVPYVRVTNSYNKSRSLRFDVGFCRKICFNGMIFEQETIEFTFKHVKHELNEDVSFVLEEGRMEQLFERFRSHANKLKSYQINKNQSFDLICALFSVKDKSEIDFSMDTEREEDYDLLIRGIKRVLDKYVDEAGENGYSVFNAITDIASNCIRNRYFRRDKHSMQRLAGNWINSFQKEIENSNFSVADYIQVLKGSPNKALHLTGSRYARDAERV